MESEIDRLHAELRQSLDRETDIRAKGRRAVKALEDKQEVEATIHNSQKEENKKLHEEAQKTDAVVIGLRELFEKKKVLGNRSLRMEAWSRIDSQHGRLYL